jgi:hypothetical protein
VRSAGRQILAVLRLTSLLIFIYSTPKYAIMFIVGREVTQSLDHPVDVFVQMATQPMPSPSMRYLLTARVDDTHNQELDVRSNRRISIT